MRKIISFMHCSVDGFAAGPGGEMDWIHVDQEIFDYANDQTENADSAIYGRVTFAMMDEYWPTAGDEPGASKHDKLHSAWYNKVEKFVLSKTLKQEAIKNAMIIADNLVSRIKALKEKQGKNIVLFGSPGAVHSLLKHGLVDELWLFINPIILGSGISFLSGDMDRIPLRLLSSAKLSSGVVCVNYEIERRNS